VQALLFPSIVQHLLARVDVRSAGVRWVAHNTMLMLLDGQSRHRCRCTIYECPNSYRCWDLAAMVRCRGARCGGAGGAVAAEQVVKNAVPHPQSVLALVITHST